MNRSGALAAVPPLTVALFAGPVAAGLLGTLLPAFGWHPGIGAADWSLDPWRELLAEPGLWRSVWLSLATGLGAALLAFAAAAGLSAWAQGTRWAGRLRLALAPLLAVPHAAFAVGVLFLAAPSGWIARLLSPWATGWERPPDFATVQDPHGLSLLLALAAKECFFLLLMMQAALAQVPAARQLRVAASLGYDRVTAWLLLVLPQLYRQMRLPVYAVIAFGCSVVDMAAVLGPAAPPTLAVLVLQMSQDPDLARRLPAAAGALLQGGVVLAAICLWRLGEIAVGRIARHLAARGGRRSLALPGRAAAWTGHAAILTTLAALVVLALWSLADRWRFPDALPERLGLQAWGAAAPALLPPFLTTLGLAAAVSLLALALVLGCLEREDRTGHAPSRRALDLLYLPLLVPQLSFLFGAQVLLERMGLAGGLLAVTWMHLLFVLPYAFLTLGDSWRALDRRFARTALCLGRSPASVFWRVKLPLLRRPILASLAVGFSVSVALYLPTLFAGAGRVTSLATEVVSLASGGDRRQLGLFGLLQALLPLAALLLAGWLGRPRFGGTR
ncbi:MAG TPA: ABC transporter permease [Azospirillaceae bacterium]|nr:ABC transporter permease [Azospirillaceae bacterium]